jgi:uncharacterized protein (TIGR03085 family)
VTSHSAAERAALVDALRAAGPDAPTLCAGWTTRDLAAHLVARERRPDSDLGLVLPVFAGWTERVRLGMARRPYPELLEQIAGGPPLLSVFSLPGADATTNLSEHFVHCEDVRRATDGWTPRPLPARRQQALWQMQTARGGLLWRRSPVPVTLQTPDGERAEVRPGTDGVQLTGEPAELMLYAMGRGTNSQVQLDGPEAAVSRFQQTSFSV